MGYVCICTYISLERNGEQRKVLINVRYDIREEWQKYFIYPGIRISYFHFGVYIHLKVLCIICGCQGRGSSICRYICNVI